MNYIHTAILEITIKSNNISGQYNSINNTFDSAN